VARAYGPLPLAVRVLRAGTHICRGRRQADTWSLRRGTGFGTQGCPFQAWRHGTAVLVADLGPAGLVAPAGTLGGFAAGGLAGRQVVGPSAGFDDVGVHGDLAGDGEAGGREQR